MTFCHETEFQEIFQCSVANLLVLGGLCCSSGKEEYFTLGSQSPWVQLWPSPGSRQHFTWKTTLEPTGPSSVTVAALVSLPICVVYIYGSSSSWCSTELPKQRPLLCPSAGCPIHFQTQSIKSCTHQLQVSCLHLRHTNPVSLQNN